tara:strand:+ start:508 stop:909 length:402 start_codon:yes stop_codon:yes gene_type:complete
MKITKRQLKRIIKEEKQKLIKEQWGSEIDTGSPLIEFARAYRSLGDAVASQVDAVVEAYHNSGGVGDQRFKEAVYDQNPNAINMAMERLGRTLRYGDLGDEGESILEALTEAEDLFDRGDLEAATDARAAGDI